MQGLTLRHYQSNDVGSIREAYRQKFRAPLYVLPTGGGKTVVFTYIGQSSASKGKRVLILVHRIELVRQTVKKLFAAGVLCGVIHPKYKPDYTCLVQVASVQTLVKRMDKMPDMDFDLVIVDEAHHATAGSWKKIINKYSKARVLGVTATPVRTDGAGLNEIFDTLIVGPQIGELIEWGMLTSPKTLIPRNMVDLSSVDVKKNGSWDEHSLARAVDKPTITGDAIKEYTKYCAYVPAVAFCVDVEHAENVARDFQAAGYGFYAVDGSFDDDLRAAILNGLTGASTDDEIKVLERNGIFGPIHGVTSCAIVSEGTDIPAIGCVIQLRPTQSLSLYLQQVGRGLRLFAGRKIAYNLDHVGNAWRHGFPEENQEWSLEGVKKKKKGDKEKAIRVKQCDKCYHCHIPGPQCPECYYIYPVQSREIEQVDGELAEVSEDEKRAMSERRKSEVRAARDLEELIAIERERGYKSGWARNVHAARNKKTTGI